MNRQTIRAIFKVISLFNLLGGKLPRFTDRNQAGPQSLGQWRAENKSTRLDRDHLLNLLADKWSRQSTDDFLKSDRLFEKGCDIVEKDSLLGKIRNFANFGFQIHFKPRKHVRG